MTVQTEVSRSGPYAGAGTTGPFTVGFRFLDDTHLRVIKTSAVGIDADLVLSTDFTVSGAGGASGSVTTAVSVAVGETLTIIRNVPFKQEADYVDGDSFPSESHEQALDLLTMQTQQIKEATDRALALPPTVSGVSAELPVPQAGRVIGWDGDATSLVNIDASTLATSVVGATKIVDVFDGTGAQTEFVLSAQPLSKNNTDVFISGIYQPKSEYSVSGLTITFGTAPPAGTDNIEVEQNQGVTYPVTSLDDDVVTTTKILNSAVTTEKIAAGAVSSHLNGQLVFPATQNPSSNANTLDDYEEGTFTPAFTFATPGNLNVVYSTQIGRYTKIGRMVYFDITLYTSTFTHTTASGNAQIAGLPFTSANDSTAAIQSCQWGGIAKAGYTSVVGAVAANSATLLIIASGSGMSAVNVTAADMPNGGSPALRFSGFYTTS